MLESLLLFGSVMILDKMEFIPCRKEEFQNSRDFGDFPAIYLGFMSRLFIFQKGKKTIIFLF